MSSSKFSVNQPTKFSMIPEWLLDIDLSAGAYMVYGALAKYANNKSKETFVSHTTLAKKLGVSRNTIINRVRELELKGAILVEHRYEGGHQKSNNYVLVWDAPSYYIESETFEEKEEKPAKNVVKVAKKDIVNDSFSISEVESTIKKKRNTKSEPLWRPLVDVCGYDPKGNKSMTSAFYVGLRELESYGATPEEIFEKAKAYKTRFGNDVEMTPKALAKWWHALDTVQPNSQIYQLSVLEKQRQEALKEENS